MKIAVLGAGVIGIATAYFLARDGHEVIVIDRQAGPGLETSFANAGEVSPGYASPWAGPAIPRKMFRWLLQRHPPLIVRPTADPAMYSWLVQMLRNCTSERYRINKQRMLRLAEYSRDVLKALRMETGIAYEERTQGTLQLFRTQKQVSEAAQDIEVLASYGIAHEVLDRAGCLLAEPGLARSDAPIAGGLRLPNDETGDCHLFATRLAALAVTHGVTYRYGTSITRIDSDGERVTALVSSGGERIVADRYVLAAASFSPQLAWSVGVRLPIYPVKGYSITIPIVDNEAAPMSTILDETYKIAVTRLGGRVRVGGMAELSGYGRDLPPRRRATLTHCVNELFPGVGDTDAASYWTGLRPMTPDGTPIIGATSLANLFINSGHGTLGWTMACGSAKIIAAQIAGHPTDIDASDLSVARYTPKRTTSLGGPR